MSYKKFGLCSLTLVTIFLVLACSTGGTPSQVEKIPSQIEKGKEIQPATKETWEVEWEKTLQAARKERTVVVYGSSTAPSLKQVAPAFNKKYGLELEVIAMDKGSALTAKLFTERKASLYLVDVLLTGTNNFFGETKPGGAVDSMDSALILPEVIDPKNWFGGQLRWGDKEHMVFMAYAFPNNSIAINTELIKPEEIKSFRDLLNPKWKGKILMNDPTLSGVGLKGFSVFGFYVLDLDYFRQLAKQEPMIIRDQRLQVEWLAKGKYPVLLFPRPAPMLEFIRAGAPVDYLSIPAEGNYISTGGGNISLVNRAPHPNAAKVLINWFLSKEGQTMVSAVEGSQSAREDVPTEGLHPSMVRRPGAKYFTGSDSEEFLARDTEYTKAAKEIFGHLVR